MVILPPAESKAISPLMYQKPKLLCQTCLVMTVEGTRINNAVFLATCCDKLLSWIWAMETYCLVPICAYSSFNYLSLSERTRQSGRVSQDLFAQMIYNKPNPITCTHSKRCSSNHRGFRSKGCKCLANMWIHFMEIWAVCWRSLSKSCFSLISKTKFHFNDFNGVGPDYSYTLMIQYDPVQYKQHGITR